MTNVTTAAPANATTAQRPVTRAYNETKGALKTTEFWIFVVISAAILIAAAVTDDNEDGQSFGAAQAWSYVAIVATGYMISRGLAKAGIRSRKNDDD